MCYHHLRNLKLEERALRDAVAMRDDLFRCLRSCNSGAFDKMSVFLPKGQAENLANLNCMMKTFLKTFLDKHNITFEKGTDGAELKTLLGSKWKTLLEWDKTTHLASFFWVLRKQFKAEFQMFQHRPCVHFTHFIKKYM